MAQVHDPKTGRITREGAIQAIKSGGSAMVNGRIHTSVDTLPSSAVFAKGNPDATEQARTQLMEQRKQLDADIASLDGTSPPEKGPSPETVATEPKDALDTMSFRDLKAMADEEGVDYAPNIGEVKLRIRIRENRASKEGAPAASGTGDIEE